MKADGRTKMAAPEPGAHRNTADLGGTATSQGKDLSPPGYWYTWSARSGGQVAGSRGLGRIKDYWEEI